MLAVFFYGTLCVPAILLRVLGHNCEDLTFQDALLPVSDNSGITSRCPITDCMQDYTRHCVKGEDYPAVIGKDDTNELVSRKEWVESRYFLHRA